MYMCEGGVSVLLLAYWPDGLVTDTHTHTHTHTGTERGRGVQRKRWGDLETDSALCYGSSAVRYAS